MGATAQMFTSGALIATNGVGLGRLASRQEWPWGQFPTPCFQWSNEGRKLREVYRPSHGDMLDCVAMCAVPPGPNGDWASVRGYCDDITSQVQGVLKNNATIFIFFKCDDLRLDK